MIFLFFDFLIFVAPQGLSLSLVLWTEVEQGFSLPLDLGGFLPERLNLLVGFLFLLEVTKLKSSNSEAPSRSIFSSSESIIEGQLFS